MLWFKLICGSNFIFLCVWAWQYMIMYDNEFQTKGNIILTKDKIKLQHIYILCLNKDDDE